MPLLSTGICHRLETRAGEPLDRRQEGSIRLVSLRLMGLASMAGLVAYLVNPAWMAWARLPLAAEVRWVGVGLSLGGVLLFAWTLHHLGSNLTDTVATRQAHTLVTTGPYRWVRHPFYGAAAPAVLGNAITSANAFLLVTGCVAMLLFACRTPREEENLFTRFGDEYREYRRRTGRFLPRL